MILEELVLLIIYYRRVLWEPGWLLLLQSGSGDFTYYIDHVYKIVGAATLLPGGMRTLLILHKFWEWRNRSHQTRPTWPATSLPNQIYSKTWCAYTAGQKQNVLVWVWRQRAHCLYCHWELPPHDAKHVNPHVGSALSCPTGSFD